MFFYNFARNDEERMIPEIINNNVHLLIPGKAAHFVRIYTEQHGGTMFEALRAFYSSKMYHELEDESTKLWHCTKILRKKTKQLHSIKR